MASRYDRDLATEIEGEVSARRFCVVATIIRDSGSVPRRTGAKMLIRRDGRTNGTIGGGIFEQRVVQDALAAIAERGSATHTYSFVPTEPGSPSTDIRTFGAVCGGRVEVFLEVIMPPDRLLIIGGGHCGRAVAEAASLLDFSITVVDDRAEYARPEEFAFKHVERVLHLTPDFEGLPEIDDSTYVVLVSKGYIVDEAALRRVINSPWAYLGMIGSLRKRETVFQNMRAAGYSEAQLARVHAPIGLDLGAETPAEIAISILAEIIGVRAKRQRVGAETAT